MGKNHTPACKINTLKYCHCLKYNATHVVKCSTHYIITRQKHIQNCSLNISPPSSLLVTVIFNISDNNIPRSAEDATIHILKKKMKLNPGQSLIEFKIGGRECISLLLHGPIN